MDEKDKLIPGLYGMTGMLAISPPVSIEIKIQNNKTGRFLHGNLWYYGEGGIDDILAAIRTVLNVDKYFILDVDGKIGDVLADEETLKWV